MSYTILGNELLTSTTFPDTTGISTKNALISVTDGELTVTDDSNPQFGTLELFNTIVTDGASINLNTIKDKVYFVVCDTMDLLGASPLSTALKVFDQEIKTESQMRIFKNTADPDIWDTKTVCFIANSELSILTFGIEDNSKYKNVRIYTHAPGIIDVNKMANIFSGDIGSNIAIGNYIKITNVPTIAQSIISVENKRITVDYEILINDIETQLYITSVNGVGNLQIPSTVGKHTITVISNVDQISILSDSYEDTDDILVKINSINIKKQIQFDFEFEFIPNTDSSNMTTITNLLSLNTNNNFLEIGDYNGDKKLKCLDQEIDITFLRDRSIIAVIRFDTKTNMLNQFGTDSEFVEQSDELRYQIGYSINNRLTYTYSPSIAYNSDEISTDNILKLIAEMPEFEITIVGLEINKNGDNIFSFDFKNDNYYSNGYYVLQNTDGTYTKNSNGLVVGAIETVRPYIDFGNKNYILENVEGNSNYNATSNILNDVLYINPIGDITKTYSGAYYKLKTKIGQEYNLICQLKVTDNTSENRIFINNDFVKFDTGIESSELITTADEWIIKKLTFTAQSTTTILRFSTSNNNITQVKNLLVYSSPVINFDNLVQEERFENLPTLLNDTTGNVSGGNTEILNNSYASIEVLTVAGTKYKFTVKLKTENIDDGNEYSGVLIAYNKRLNEITRTNIITQRSIYEEKSIIFTAESDITYFAIKPHNAYSVYSDYKSAKLINIVEYTNNISQEDQIEIQKKFEYALKQSIPDYFIQTYPKFIDFITYYGKFLDEQFGKTIYSLIDIYTPNIDRKEFLQTLENQFLKNVIDSNKFKMIDQSRILFLTLSKLFLSTKLNAESIKFLFTGLRQFQYIDDNGNTITIDKLNFTYNESESWWTPPQSFFDDNPTSTPYEVYPQDENVKPFTYQFSLDSTQDAIEDILKTTHPVGYFAEFVSDYAFEETVGITDEAEFTATIINYYNDMFAYDNTIDHGLGTDIIINDDTQII